MFRKLTLAAAIGLFSMAAVIAADGDKPGPAGKPGKGTFDKSKMFEKMDANADGKVSKEEFKKFQEQMAEKLKGKLGDKADMMAKMFEKMFEKMDANNDGVVTKEEFEKMKSPFGGGSFGKGKLDPSKFKKKEMKSDNE